MTTITTTLFFLFVASLLVQICYWWLIFKVLAKQPNTSIVPKEDPFISIIAVYKNPKIGFTALLDKLSRQEYSSKEVVLMDDFSKTIPVDPDQYPDFQLYTPSEDLPGKKKALTEAIEHAKGQYILVTDADCEPISTEWVTSMASYLSDSIKIVLGYSPYRQGPGFLNKFIRFESWLVGVQYLSYAKQGMPYMGVGRNMLYEKELFQSANPFKKNPKLLSGDDDLFINAAATSKNTAVCIEQRSFVYSEPKETWSAYFQQKKRHISTASTYKKNQIFLLSLFSLSQILGLFIGLFLALTSWWLYVLSFFISYIVLKWIIASPLLKILKEDDLIVLFPVLDLFYTLFIVVLTPFLLFKTNKW